MVASSRAGRSGSVQAISPTPKGNRSAAGIAHCSATKSAVWRPLTPIIPRPPACATARTSAPPDTPAIGAPMIGVDRSNQRVSGVVITGTSCRCPARSPSEGILLLRRRTAVLGALELPEQLVAALRTGGVLLHDLAEEASDVVQSGVVGVPDVLAVVVARLQRVVLDGDQVVRDVGESGLTRGHRSSSIRSGWDPAPYPRRTVPSHADQAGGASEKAPPVTSPPPASSARSRLVASSSAPVAAGSSSPEARSSPSP